MIEHWKALSQDNRVKLVIVILGAVFAVLGYLGKPSFESTKPASGKPPATVTQTTSGDGSPAVSGTKGDVTINMNSPAPGKQP